MIPICAKCKHARAAHGGMICAQRPLPTAIDPVTGMVRSLHIVRAQQGFFYLDSAQPGEEWERGGPPLRIATSDILFESCREANGHGQCTLFEAGKVHQLEPEEDDD